MRACLTLVATLVALLSPAVSQAGGPAAPAPDATILLKEVELTVHHDGRVDRRVHTVTRLHSMFAINRLGDPRIEYDSLRQELQVVAARTITSDGRSMDAPAYAMNRSTPDASAQCPDFAFVAELVVTFVGLEKESVIELQYVVRDKAPWQSHGEIEFYFGDRLPVKESRLKVRVPARGNLHRSVRPAGAALSEAEPVHERATTTHEWTAADLPGYPHHGWDRSLRVPGIVVSTAPSWADLLEPLAVAAVSLAGYSQWEGLAAHLLPPDKPATSDAARLALLVKGFKDSFRVVQLGPGAEPLSPRLLPRVAESRCATPLEGALLLASALGDMGLRPTVLLTTGARPGLESQPPPAGALVKDAYVAVNVDGVPVFINAATFALSGGIRNGHRKWLAGFSPRARHFLTPGREYLKGIGASVSVQAHAAIGPDGLKISGSFDTAGLASLWYDHPSGLDAAAGAGLVKAAFGPALVVDKLETSSSYPGRFSAQFEAHLALGEPRSAMIALKSGPFAQRLEGWLTGWLAGKADGPDAAGPLEYSATLSFRGEGADFIGGIADTDLGAGEASYRVRVAREGKLVTVTRRLVLPSADGPRSDAERALAVRFAADNGRDNILAMKAAGE